MELRAVLLWMCLSALAALAGCGNSNSLPLVVVNLSPKRSAVAAGVQAQQFIATVTGDGSNSGVNWSVDGIVGGSPTVGNITRDGNYTPLSATAGTHTVTATSVVDPTKSAFGTVAVSDLPGVFTYHNNLNRDGNNPQEYALSSSTVSTTTFGKLFSCPVDGAVYTQPLWVPGVSIGGVIHNVIYVATQHDTVFALDADANPCVILWQANLLDAIHGGAKSEVPVVWTDVGYCTGEVYPEVGVKGTPVIDPNNSTIYLVSASEIPGPQSGNCPLPTGSYYHRLHALNLTTGAEKVGAPMTIAASVVGTGDGSSGGFVSFSSQLEHQRSGLALSGDGTVYVAFASHEDATPYHGWLLGYRGSNVQQQLSSFNTTPNGIGGADGGIWASGGAPAVDSGNDVYVSTGNGIFDQGSGLSMENDYGDSVLRLTPAPGITTPNGANLNLVDYFTPNDQSCLAATDADLGSGAPVILQDQTTAGLPAHLLVQLGKAGAIYLLDRDNMGLFQTNDCLASSNQIVQSFSGTGGGFWGTPAFWQKSLYFAGAGDVLKQFSFDSTSGQFNTKVSSQSSQVYAFPGASPSVSSHGDANGIVWAIDASLYGFGSPNAAGGVNCYLSPLPPACTGPAILHAYDATNLAQEYWNSTQATNNRDQAGAAVKFIPPTVANGKVYVGTRTEIDVYGLLPN
jgi:hypothetical protein